MSAELALEEDFYENEQDVGEDAPPEEEEIEYLTPEEEEAEAAKARSQKAAETLREMGIAYIDNEEEYKQKFPNGEWVPPEKYLAKAEESRAYNKAVVSSLKEHLDATKSELEQLKREREQEKLETNIAYVERDIKELKEFVREAYKTIGSNPDMEEKLSGDIEKVEAGIADLEAQRLELRRKHSGMNAEKEQQALQSRGLNPYVAALEEKLATSLSWWGIDAGKEKLVADEAVRIAQQRKESGLPVVPVEKMAAYLAEFGKSVGDINTVPVERRKLPASPTNRGVSSGAASTAQPTRLGITSHPDYKILYDNALARNGGNKNAAKSAAIEVINRRKKQNFYR